MTSDDNNVVRLEGTDWYSAEELANRLDVSVRTIYRRLERGRIEKRETARGTVYRVVDDVTGDTEEVTKPDTSADKTFGEAVLRIVDQNSVQSERIAELSGDVARLEARLDAALEDKERLLRYVQESDQRLDDIVDELEETESALMKSRARAYLEAGRRELADERLADARETAEELRADNEDLRKKLERAEARRSGWKPFG